MYSGIFFLTVLHVVHLVMLRIVSQVSTAALSGINTVRMYLIIYLGGHI